MNDYERDYLRWYAYLYRNPGKVFDPGPLVRAARAQWSDRPLLVLAFARCTRAWARDELYTHFITPLEQGTRWRFAGNLFLQVPGLGGLVADLVHDADVPGGLSIGGIEYLDRVMGHPVDIARLVEGMLAVQVRFRKQAVEN